MSEEENEDTGPNESDIAISKISFVLSLLMNEYEIEDIASVAQALADAYKKQLACLDCGDDVVEKQEFFLVHDDLRAEVGLDHGTLCVGCFEKRLGRELFYFDFTTTMISEQELDHSDRLKNRINNGLAETLSDE